MGKRFRHNGLIDAFFWRGKQGKLRAPKQAIPFVGLNPTKFDCFVL
jgi:hypothetical protein